MSLSDLGQVYAYLLQHRIIESKPISRKFRRGEEAAARILKDNPGMMGNLSSFLEPMGFEVKVWDETMAPGISSGGFVYLMVRSDFADPPCYGEDRFFELLRDGQAEARDVTAVWFLHLWLMLSHLLYSAINRSPADVIRYNEATVTLQIFQETVKNHIEQRRNEGPPDSPSAQEVYGILTSHKRLEVSRRAKKFLDAMTEARLLEEVKDEPDLYRQTLLGAVEFDQLYNRSFASMFSDGETETIEAITEIVVGESATTTYSASSDLEGNYVAS